MMTMYTGSGCDYHNQSDPSQRSMRIAVTDENSNVLVYKALGGGSNNIGELWAVAEAMVYANTKKLRSIDIHTSSTTILEWLDHQVGKNINSEKDVENLLLTIDKRRSRVTMTATWIPSEDNLAALYLKSIRRQDLNADLTDTIVDLNTNDAMVEIAISISAKALARIELNDG